MTSSLASYSHKIWFTTSSESVFRRIRFASRASHNCNLAITASYSASLFVALNWNFKAYSFIFPFGVISISPAPTPTSLDDPSANSCQTGS